MTNWLLDVQHHKNKILLVLEYLEFNLWEFMRKFPSTAKDLHIIKILHGVSYCHSQKIIHQDLKPRNLLIDRNKILKIADFGMSRSVDVPLKIYTKKVASLCYMASEILFGDGQYSAPVDIWLLGTPNEETWPGVTSLFPCLCEIIQSPPQDLAEEVPGLEPAGVDLLSEILKAIILHRACTSILSFFCVDLNQLKSYYPYANQDALRAALRYRHCGWVELLNFEPTYRYSRMKKTRVTDFLLEPSPEPDPNSSQINLIPFTEEQEMAKRRAVRALITEQTITPIAEVQTEAPQAG
ncbi:cell division control protein 2 homolog [Camellia sinensis]|uniref:cell division control protein 2 homolog n=1 Tax=Camellia sinensis TaxID=4442 RepID=UPI001036BA08|nr:cell division control protein 2 homolog [Camellia sinensis]